MFPETARGYSIYGGASFGEETHGGPFPIKNWALLSLSFRTMSWGVVYDIHGGAEPPDDRIGMHRSLAEFWRA